jgi:hypothetical protein
MPCYVRHSVVRISVDPPVSGLPSAGLRIYVRTFNDNAEHAVVSRRPTNQERHCRRSAPESSLVDAVGHHSPSMRLKFSHSLILIALPLITPRLQRMQ